MQDRPIVTDYPGSVVKDMNAVEVFLQRGLFQKRRGACRKRQPGCPQDQARKTNQDKAHEPNGSASKKTLSRLPRHYSMEPPRMMVCRVARLNMLAGKPWL